MSGDTELSEFFSALEKLKRSSLSEHQKNAGLTLIFKIIDNILKHPTEDKYRSVKRSSSAYKTKILLEGNSNSSLIEALLLQCGFGVYESSSSSTAECSTGTVEILPTVSFESLTLIRDCLLAELEETNTAGKHPSEQSIPKNSSPNLEALKSTSRLRRNDPIQQEEENLRQLRETQAQRFQHHIGGPPVTANSSSETSHLTSFGQGTQRESGTGVSGLLSSFFRAPSRNRNNRETQSSGSRVMTLKHLPKVTRGGG